MPAPRTNTQPVKWTPRLDALLGKSPDAVVAAVAGCSGESVRRRREHLGVDACRAERAWTPAAVELLGTAPDVDVARKLGVSRVAVRIQRHRRAIPAFAPPARRLQVKNRK